MNTKINRIVAIGYLFILIGCFGSIWILQGVLDHNKTVGISLIIWLVLPYLAIAIILPAHKQIIRNAFTSTLVAIVVAIIGLLILLYIFYDRQDPGGVIPALMLPLYQDVLIIMLVPISKWIRKKIL